MHIPILGTTDGNKVELDLEKWRKIGKAPKRSAKALAVERWRATIPKNHQSNRGRSKA